MSKNLDGMGKIHTFALAFGKQASFGSAEAPAGPAMRRPDGDGGADGRPGAAKKIGQKFGGFRILPYLCKVFPPDGILTHHCGARAEAGRKIPEDIERLTIDKDKKVQELKRRQVWNSDGEKDRS